MIVAVLHLALLAVHVAFELLHGGDDLRGLQKARHGHYDAVV